MRPLSLHCSGFGVFREAVDVDFEGVDYFALVGPTGAGKSTVIDAVCFALYGSVPRYGDERLTARVVSIGKQEAKVSLAFAVGDARYRATRIVRVRANKASTPEAVLERVHPDGSSEVLAASAREMKPAVEHLLGLPFAHFTKCVVLPQGEFARFLHDDPAKRRDLLTKLLDLEIYDRIGQLARQRAAAAKHAVDIHERQLAAFAGVTEDARVQATRRREQLRELHRCLDDARPDDERRLAAIADADARAQHASQLATELAAIAVPASVAELAGAGAAVGAAVEAAATTLERTRRVLGELDTEIESLPDRHELARAHEAHTEAAALDDQLGAAATAEEATASDLARVTELVDRAEQHLTEAQDGLDAARAAHAAHALTATLVAGEACPVCTQVVEQVPKRRRPAALTKREADLVDARAIVAGARDALQEASRANAATAARREELAKQLEALAAITSEHPDPAALRRELDRVDHVLEARRRALLREREARAEEAAANDRARSVTEAVRELHDEVRSQRDRLLRRGLEPPPLVDDLAAAWTEFATWAEAAHAEQDAAVATATAAATEARADRHATFERFREDARRLDIDTTAEDLTELRDDVLEQGRDARNELQRIEDALEQSRKITEEMQAAHEEHEVATLVGNRLRSDRFEKWLLAEALGALVGAASQNLYALSAGQYSLRSSDEDEFVVVDHRNADETRSVRTLSGGETFQASLALALALSDQLTEMSAVSGAKLDALFLDEGFGTLDADTLETVAATIETLGTSGRMVGIVTHVPALAERVPVRYRVTRTDHCATVDREDL
jgi:exonuclease SbcC